VFCFKSSRVSSLGESSLDLGSDSGLPLGAIELSVPDVLPLLGVLDNNGFVTLLADNLSGGLGFGNLGSDGALPDFSMSLLVEGLESGSLSGGKAFGPLAELSLEPLLVILLEDVHVLLDVASHDVLSVLLGIVRSGSSFGSFFLGLLASLGGCSNSGLR
jgi:hypothetical protein